jgi:branched-chain amino acid transport system permease protein
MYQFSLRTPATGALFRISVPLLPEACILALGLAGFFLFPSDLAFLTNILITSLFVLSLSLVLGQAGIPTLGHAAYFGSGAYAAALFAIHVTSDPLLGLLTGGLVAAIVAAVSGALLLRTRGLTFLMLTIAAAQILYELANQASAITGGDDGLAGVEVDRILGLFSFDLYSRTAYLYALAVLVLSYLLLRILTQSPFGLAARGIRSDATRMPALGCNVYAHLLAVFVIGGFFAGIAGGLSAQTAQVVGLSSLSFTTSGDALVMLILGGSRRLPGALVGTVVFTVIHHIASTINPYHWLFLIGAMLIVSVILLPDGLIGLGAQSFARFKKELPDG